jgi:hypothetical protein
MGVEAYEARRRPKRMFDEQHLADLIRLAVRNRAIDEASERQAALAKDARRPPLDLSFHCLSTDVSFCQRSCHNETRHSP